MNADGTNQTNLTNTQSVDEWNVIWSPDGSKLAYTRHTWPTTRENQPDIYVMNADGTNQVNLTDTMPEVMSVANPNWSPDGIKVAFLSCLGENGQNCNIYVMNADGTNPVNITKKPVGYYGFGTDAAHTLDWQRLPAPTPPKGRDVTVHPPDTGGPSLLLVASALLFAVGRLLYAVVRRGRM
jgi:Tol biopolymer transport system component